jgi:alkylation response protein AidB-like acyl-CoA dehydrogenase
MPYSDAAVVADLVAEASEWVPTLRSRSAETEQLRKIPEETEQEFIRHGFHRTAQPKRFGGMGLGIDAVTEVAMEVGLGCCSTAWMAGQWPGHQFMVGMFSEQAQEEYWGPSPDTMSSTASAVVKLDTKLEGEGLRVTAQMKFSSGCDYADWILLSTPTHLGLVPRSDFRVEDDWYVSGLRGTGSKGIVIEDAFIPKHRLVPVELLGTNQTPGASLYTENPFYHVPIGLVLNTMLLSPTVGMARGVIELFDERAVKRFDNHTGMRACERPGTQLRFAESAVEVDCAILLLRSIMADLVAWGSSGEVMPLDERARLRRNITYTTRLCLAAADRLLESGDASGQYDPQLWQRWGRDIHMAGLQMALTWDEPAMSYSQVRWGLEPSSRFT